MSKKNRKSMAATATRIRKARRGRKAKGKATSIESIGSFFVDQELVYAFTKRADGEVIGLEPVFRLHTFAGNGNSEFHSRYVTILVMPDYKNGSITVYAPRVWSLKGVADQARDTFFENLLDASLCWQITPIYHDGELSPAVMMAADSPANEVFNAVLRILGFVQAWDGPVLGTIETGTWVKPEVPEVDDDTLSRAFEECTRRLEKEYEERATALAPRVTSVLERFMKRDRGGERVAAAVEMLKSVESLNEIFVCDGHIKSMCSVADLRAMERLICDLEAEADDLEAGDVTAD